MEARRNDEDEDEYAQKEVEMKKNKMQEGNEKENKLNIMKHTEKNSK